MNKDIDQFFLSRLGRVTECATEENSKQNLIYWSSDDWERTKKNLDEWQRRGAVKILADLDSSPPKTKVLRGDGIKLNWIARKYSIWEGV